jgi:rhamnose utilization protein RhaD (predicted bifunctional aldolase and dehydrogenase)
MGSSIFDFVAAEIERHTRLATLEARGTLRLALKQAGLDARQVTTEQMSVVLERVLPGEMRSRGVLRPDEVCRTVARALRVAHPDAGAAGDTPEAIFRRLARG